MAHIASCIQSVPSPDCLSIASYIVRPISPLPRSSEPEEQPSKPWPWRMTQSTPRQYQLFPSSRQTAASPVQGLDPEQAFAVAMGHAADKADGRFGTNSLRLRMKEHTPIRRRKVSVPELGPMTTVHESSMDSPTLPSRPTLHERSVSAPGHGWKQHHVVYQATGEKSQTRSDHVARTPPSPKNLPPLMIPSQMSALSPLKKQSSTTRLRNCNNSTESITRSAISEEPSRSRPYTPTSASQPATTPMSAKSWYSAMTPVSASTPLSSILDVDAGPSPRTCKPENVTFERTKEQLPDKSVVESMQFPRAEIPSTSKSSHRRNASESGSIMDRGRPRQKSDTPLRQSASLASQSAERRAFEQLPKGWRMADAVQMLDSGETSALHRQALQQVERFEILRKTDVDSLSKELRNLDERCLYLRRTYHSLRAGRRNLHSRICQCLRSPRTVKFSQEALLKQEEALGELDASIDDWVSKLEQAENRRTRIRQKLLEHVAAAVVLPDRNASAEIGQTPFMLDNSKAQTRAVTASTPPRSPVRVACSPRTGSSSSSPCRVVAQVPFTIIEQPLVEEQAASSAVGLGIEPVAADGPCTAGIRRAEVESIRIYAGDEVAALLADVEEQITQMSNASEQNAAQRQQHLTNLSEQERRQLHHAQSQEALLGISKNIPPPSGNIDATTPPLQTLPATAFSRSGTQTSTLSPPTSVSASTSAAAAPVEDLSCYMLTSAVFNPKTAVAH